MSGEVATVTVLYVDDEPDAAETVAAGLARHDERERHRLRTRHRGDDRRGARLGGLGD